MLERMIATLQFLLLAGFQISAPTIKAVADQDARLRAPFVIVSKDFLLALVLIPRLLDVSGRSWE